MTKIYLCAVLDQTPDFQSDEEKMFSAKLKVKLKKTRISVGLCPQNKIRREV